jgi:hypothetical protein
LNSIVNGNDNGNDNDNGIDNCIDNGKNNNVTEHQVQLINNITKDHETKGENNNKHYEKIKKKQVIL